MNIQIFTAYRYVYNWLSPILRKPKIFSYLKSLLAPFQSFRDNLTTNVYPSLEKKARYNAQVRKFEQILNDLFNPELVYDPIYIDEAFVNRILYSYNDPEPQAPSFYSYNDTELEDPSYTYNPLEYLPTFDFTVHVPTAIYNTKLAQIKALINKLSLAGVTWNVIPF